MMKPQFTICIPTYYKPPLYSRHKILKDAIFTIKNQTFKDFEAIIISDGDTVDAYVKDYIDGLEDLRFNYICAGKNYGDYGYPTKNYCMEKAANGKYFVSMDDDDLLFPNYLETFEELIKKHEEPVFVLCGTEIYRTGKETEAEFLNTFPPMRHWVDKIQMCIKIRDIRENKLYFDSKIFAADGVLAEKISKAFGYYASGEITCCFKPQEERRKEILSLYE